MESTKLLSKYFAAAIIAFIASLVPLRVNSEVKMPDESARPSFRGGYDAEQCAALIGECLRFGLNERVSCLDSTARHLFCNGGNLGKLARKRASINSRNADADPDIAARIYDQVCLENFDNLFSSKLIGGSLGDESVRNLTSALDGCAAKASPDLLQP